MNRKKKDDNQKIVHLNLRLPSDLHKRLTLEARDEDRSLHAYVLRMLKKSFEASNPSDSIS